MSTLFDLISRVVATVLYHCPGLATAWVELEARMVPVGDRHRIDWYLYVACPDEETYRRNIERRVSSG